MALKRRHRIARDEIRELRGEEISEAQPARTRGGSRRHSTQGRETQAPTADNAREQRGRKRASESAKNALRDPASTSHRHQRAKRARNAHDPRSQSQRRRSEGRQGAPAGKGKAGGATGKGAGGKSNKGAQAHPRCTTGPSPTSAQRAVST